MQEDAVRLWAMANKDAMFEEYAAVCVEEWKARSRDTTPLRIYLNSAAKPRPASPPAFRFSVSSQFKFPA
jgi:hypothetical protein